MTGNARPSGRFLGRPDGVDPGYVPSGANRSLRPAPGVAPRPRSRAGRLWLGQAITGALLLGFLAVHLAAQHFLAPGGLRDHDAVIAYLRQPIAVAAELALLASVVAHACLGMRSSLVDVLGDAGLHRASLVIAGVGLAAVGYGAWLLYAIVS